MQTTGSEGSKERYWQPLLRLSKGLEMAKSYAEVLDTARKEVREIVEYQNSGSISVTFSPEKGSVFLVELPLEEAKEAEQREILGIAGGSDYRILIVEDQRDNQLLLQTLMENIGLSVHIASNGEEGVRLFESYRPHFIWMDRRMPVIDGFELCRLLKSWPQLGDIPVIFVSALSETEEKVQGFAVGAVNFVTKPYQREVLLARVRTHIELHRLGSRLEEMVKARSAALIESEKKLRTSMFDSITTLAAMVELRDPYTAGHQKRVQARRTQRTGNDDHTRAFVERL